MLMRFDPFREMDRLVDELAAAGRTPRPVPLDAYRSGDHVVVHLDLPGADPGSIEVTVDRGVLTIKAQRTERPTDGVEWIARERFAGAYAKQIHLGEGLDTDAMTATYDAGVLTLSVPIAERAKPRRVEVTSGASAPQPKVIEGASAQVGAAEAATA
jgi:HSP20 family protein